MSTVRHESAVIEIATSDPSLSEAISRQIREAMSQFAVPPRYPTIRVRTFRRLEAIDVTGRIAVVRVTEPGLRRLPALVEAIRARGALGVQLVWDGITPTRDRAEAAIFRVLETARATKGAPPVVLAPETTPARALRAVIAARSPS